MKYEMGQGVHQDHAEAVKWYRKAAIQNLPEAQYNLGVLYLNGKGVEQNSDIAQNWFSKACDNGLVEGCEKKESLSK